MFNLVYASTAAQPFSSADLVELLSRAHEKNAALDVTGLLLYRKGRFMQALEGEESVVRSLYRTIGADPRHHGVAILLAVPVSERLFPRWSMGFQSVGEPDIESVPGYNPSPDLPPFRLDLRWHESVAMRLLAGFIRES